MQYCTLTRRVKENEQKKREAKENGIKVSCKRMVSIGATVLYRVYNTINSQYSLVKLTG